MFRLIELNNSLVASKLNEMLVTFSVGATFKNSRNSSVSSISFEKPCSSLTCSHVMISFKNLKFN